MERELSKLRALSRAARRLRERYGATMDLAALSEDILHGRIKTMPFGAPAKSGSRGRAVSAKVGKRRYWFVWSTELNCIVTFLPRPTKHIRKKGVRRNAEKWRNNAGVGNDASKV